MGSVSGMLAQMRALIGTGEYPPGSNSNKVTDWYGFDDAWCDMTVSYAAAHSDNLGAVCGKFAYTVAHANAFKAKGRWHYGLGGIRPGDIVFFDWDGSRTIGRIDHVGVVEAVHSNGTITTIEGNTSDKCQRRSRNSACVVGYGRPSYGDASPLPPTDGILRKGSKGAAVKTLQKNLNTVMKSGLVVDGDFGAATDTAVRAFQKKYGLTVDGQYGPASAAVMKSALKGGTKPTPPAPRPPAAGKLTVDGEFGPATCAAMQRALNKHGAKLSVDGSFGPLTKKALQGYLKVTADGVVGPNTVKALQKKVGSGVDGKWGADTTRHLQTALNAGTF
ncbi:MULTISPECIES: peptidoglycan-binding protein [Streptomyces]|uniref:Peptidoglycan-binding protein n=1 Tax=Streptomyces doebereineriae TaxID=3075528 RepID=A0ABU2V2S8_9ACTN|nr:peptidoglycan-binding protein [Streptomyces sp. DSM 41640]MDT0479856.1 peptidoglycan-binding protein [Streptomyces sp. DSM 41640]